MKDFTYSILSDLIREFVKHNYSIQTFEQFVLTPSFRTIIIRHDIDRFPSNALKMTSMEKDLGIQTTYFFRTVNNVFKEKIIRSVVDFGHEVAYHYEDLTLAKGDFDKAIISFKSNLSRIRKYYPCKTICMHGSPLSKWDNKKLWSHRDAFGKKYDYRDFGIIADTSLDINYDEVFYITDNGMGWNKTDTSIRDKVESKFNIPIRSSEHFIELIKENKLPDKIMLNAHPDTFFDPGVKWLLNYSLIKSKNIVKRIIVKSGIYN